MEEEREYLGDQMAIIIWVPADSKELKIEASLGDFSVISELDEDGVKEAREDYLMLDPDDDAFALYRFAPEFKAFVEAGEKMGKSFEEISEDWDIYRELIMKEMY